MIILLGPDNTGKSTLAKQLKESGNGLMSLHCNTDTGFDNYYSWLSNPQDLINRTVFDRWFFCDIPYAKIVRGEKKSKYTYQQIHILNTLTKMFKPLIILCTNQADNFDEREQLSTSDQHDALLLDYKRMLCVLQQPYTVYDWKNPQVTIDEIVARHTAELPLWVTKAMDTPV